MKEANLFTSWEGGGKNVIINVPIVFFEEESVHFAYIPSFDLIGYGKTAQEARESLKITLDEFLRYTINKNTFILELKRLGWKIKSKDKPMLGPQMSDMVNTNEQLRDIINHKNFTTSNFQINIPAFA